MTDRRHQAASLLAAQLEEHVVLLKSAEARLARLRAERDELTAALQQIVRSLPKPERRAFLYRIERIKADLHPRGRTVGASDRTRAALRFLKSKLTDDADAEQYRPQLVEVTPGHFVAEHDPVLGSEGLLVG